MPLHRINHGYDLTMWLKLGTGVSNQHLGVESMKTWGRPVQMGMAAMVRWEGAWSLRTQWARVFSVGKSSGLGENGRQPAVMSDKDLTETFVTGSGK